MAAEQKVFSFSNSLSPLYTAVPVISRVAKTVTIPVKLIKSEYIPYSSGKRRRVYIGVKTTAEPRSIADIAVYHIPADAGFFSRRGYLTFSLIFIDTFFFCISFHEKNKIFCNFFLFSYCTFKMVVLKYIIHYFKNLSER